MRKHIKLCKSVFTHTDIIRIYAEPCYLQSNLSVQGHTSQQRSEKQQSAEYENVLKTENRNVIATESCFTI